MNDHDFAACVRSDLGLFIERVFMHLYPSTPFLPNWHIELIASRLEAVLDGKITRLIINVPPRSLKSVMASVAFVAWALGRNPNLQLICASYGQDLADKLAMDCRNVMQSEWYQRLYATRLAGLRPAVADLRTTTGGGRFATSVGGVLTGRGGDIIIVDDPLKPASALSDAERQAANDWMDHTVMSRLNDKKSGAIIIIMQRLHQDDVVGHLLEQGDWELLSLPAIAEVEERFTISSVFGEREIVRHVGDLLHPARESAEVLDGLRKTLGEYHFAGQYQQRPAPLGGGIVKLEWFRQYGPHELPDTFDEVVQSWDTGNKTSELSAHSVCTTWGRKGKVIYLLDVWRQQVDFPNLVRAVIACRKRFNPSMILVEDAASGIQLGQQLKALEIYNVKMIKPQGEKAVRLSTQSTAIENGLVHLPREAHWRDVYLHELTTFPASRFADQVDSTSQALAYLTGQNRISHQGLLDYMAAEVARMNGGNTRP